MKNWYWPKLDEAFFASMGRVFTLSLLLLIPLATYIIFNDLIRKPPQPAEHHSIVSNSSADNRPVKTESTDAVDPCCDTKSEGDKKSEIADLTAQEGM